MNIMTYEQRIIKLIESDPLRMKALRTVYSLNLPDCLIAAGFIRNLIWNNIFDIRVESNDVDVIYFCRQDASEERDRILEKRLFEMAPDLPWSVTNQARIHTKYGDEPYQNTLDAMSFWPEKQTSIGARLDHKGKVVIRHSFDLLNQFSGKINRNPRRTVATFKSRVSSKRWLEVWPSMDIET